MATLRTTKGSALTYAEMDSNIESSGATSFTELADAPGTITPNSFLVGNDDGTALVAPDWLVVDAPAHEFSLLVADPDTEGQGARFQVRTATGATGASIYSDETASMVTASFGNMGTSLMADANGTTLSVWGGAVMILDGLDTPATDTTARLTVDAVEYSIAKAVKIKIGADTYFCPLFGPVAP